MFGKFIRWPMMKSGPVEFPTTIKAVDTPQIRRLVETARERGYSGGRSLEFLWDRVDAEQRFYLQPFSIENTPERCYRCSCVTDFGDPGLGIRYLMLDVKINEFGALPTIESDEFFLLLRTLMREPPDLSSAFPDEDR